MAASLAFGLTWNVCKRVTGRLALNFGEYYGCPHIAISISYIIAETITCAVLGRALDMNIGESNELLFRKGVLGRL